MASHENRSAERRHRNEKSHPRAGMCGCAAHRRSVCEHARAHLGTGFRLYLTLHLRNTAALLAAHISRRRTMHKNMFTRNVLAVLTTLAIGSPPIGTKPQLRILCHCPAPKPSRSE